MAGFLDRNAIEIYLVQKMTNNILYNDVELLLRIKMDDEAALACLMRKYYPGLYRFAFQFTRNEEVIKLCIQDVFVGLWKQRGFANRIFSLQAYLFRDTWHKLNQRKRQDTDIVYPNLNLYAN